MDLRKMQQFVAVAEELHFGRAAKRLNMAQPPLSQAIRRLEVELGVDLFKRSKRSVELTRAGEVFLVEARKTVKQATLAYTLAKRVGADSPEVRLGLISSALFRVLPGLIIKFRAVRPDVEVRLFERRSTEQIDLLRSGNLDFAFLTHLSEPENELDSMVVERTRPVAAVPADSALAEGTSIDLAELAKQPFILPPERYAKLYSETLEMFKAVGTMPQVIQEATQLNTTISLVGAGLGCSIVAHSALIAEPHNVKFLKIENLPPRRDGELSMFWHRETLNSDTRNFLSVARDYVAENSQLLDPSITPH